MALHTTPLVFCRIKKKLSINVFNISINHISHKKIIEENPLKVCNGNNGTNIFIFLTLPAQENSPKSFNSLLIKSNICNPPLIPKLDSYYTLFHF